MVSDYVSLLQNFVLHLWLGSQGDASMLLSYPFHFSKGSAFCTDILRTRIPDAFCHSWMFVEDPSYKETGKQNLYTMFSRYKYLKDKNIYYMLEVSQWNNFFAVWSVRKIPIICLFCWKFWPWSQKCAQFYVISHIDVFMQNLQVVWYCWLWQTT